MTLAQQATDTGGLPARTQEAGGRSRMLNTAVGGVCAVAIAVVTVGWTALLVRGLVWLVWR